MAIDIVTIDTVTSVHPVYSGRFDLDDLLWVTLNIACPGMSQSALLFWLWILELAVPSSVTWFFVRPYSGAIATACKWKQFFSTQLQLVSTSCGSVISWSINVVRRRLPSTLTPKNHRSILPPRKAVPLLLCRGELSVNKPRHSLISSSARFTALSTRSFLKIPHLLNIYSRLSNKAANKQISFIGGNSPVYDKLNTLNINAYSVRVFLTC